MNKSDLVDRLTEQLKTLSRKEVDLIVDTVFDKMTEALGHGDRIEIRGFGSFEVRTRNARQGRNPKSGEKVFVTTRRVPFFKVGKELKERINDGGETAAAPVQKASGE
ncbi:MAG TPA: integration host factor subunit beta [bacterium]|nr:integration host factor subunit beta [bacterium]